MIAIGVIHIVLLLLAYLVYAFITLKSFSGKTSYLMLAIANAMYLIGFVLGMIWAKVEWGYFISLDVKMILSIALFFPFVAENIARTRKWYLPLAGMLLMAANYIVPMLMGSVHTH